MFAPVKSTLRSDEERMIPSNCLLNFLQNDCGATLSDTGGQM